MRSLKEFIGKRDALNQVSALDDKTIFFLFRKIIREEYGLRGTSELEPVAFSAGILSIKSKNPLYSSELWVRRGDIIARMNRELGQEAVQDFQLVRYAP